MKIIILRSNPVNPDVRVIKVAEILSELGKIHILAWDREGTTSKIISVKKYTIQRLKLTVKYTSRLRHFYRIIWWGYVFIYLCFSRHDVIHACDFDTYFPALLAAKIRRKKIVYDIFDFYFEMSSWPKKIIQVLSWFDKKIMEYADLVILADETRIEQIAPAKPKKIIVFYNIPNITNKTIKWLANIQAKKNYFFYGGLLAADKMITEMIQMFIKNSQWKIDIAGWGKLEKAIIQISKKHQNISFIGKISYKRVLEKTAESNVIFAFYNPKIPNNIYASPNKLFESIYLSKPIISNFGIKIAQLIAKYQIGELIKYGDAKMLREKIIKIISRQKQTGEYTKDMPVLRKKYNIMNNQNTLLDAYKEIMRFNNNDGTFS